MRVIASLLFPVRITIARGEANRTNIVTININFEAIRKSKSNTNVNITFIHQNKHR